MVYGSVAVMDGLHDFGPWSFYGSKKDDGYPKKEGPALEQKIPRLVPYPL